LINSFKIGKINQRGIYAVTGGIEEGKIARRYQGDALALRVKYPKTSKMLNQLGELYLHDSRRDQVMAREDFY